MFRKVLLYGLPVYLYALELFLKSVANISQDSVAGPTLAGAGIGFLLPLTEFKDVTTLPADVATALKSKGGKAYAENDKKLVDFIWLTFFLSLIGWMYSLRLTFSGAQLVWQVSSIPLNVSLTIGCAVFVASIILTEMKEAINV